MSFFTRLVGVGGPADVGGPTPDGEGAETVERLVDRIQTSTLLEDRRDAVKALKSLAKRYRLQVGSIAMNTLIEVLRNDKDTPEMTSLALDTLTNVINENDDTDDESDELGEQFVEIFIKTPEHVSLLISLLEDYEFSVRRPAIELVTGLLRHRLFEVQEVLMREPNGIHVLMDLLQDRREVLRNSALLLMGELTRGNIHIQKLLAFENAFDILMGIIFQEGVDSIVVEDCLYVMLNLLKNNPSNQQHFREASMIQSVAGLLKELTGGGAAEGETDENGDVTFDREGVVAQHQSPQRTANTIFVLQVVRALVSPANGQPLVVAAQNIAFHCGLFQDLCEILMADGVSSDILTEAIVTVAEVCRGNRRNQDYFAAVHSPGEKPKPAVLVLLISMTSEKQPFKLRCAVLYCLQAYLYKNDSAKAKIIETLLPASAEVGSPMTAGHFLCTALIGNDSLQVWLGSVALMHCISDAPLLKNQLLRVQLATSLGEAPVSLLHQISSQLIASQSARKPQLRAALLMLLATWLVDCPVAVSHFLHRDENIHHLTSQIDSGMIGDGQENDAGSILQGLCAFILAACLHYNDDSVEKKNRNTLEQIVERRIGREALADRIESISRSEWYVKAAQRPQPTGKAPGDLLLDFQFTKLFRRVEDELVKSLRPTSETPLTNGVTQNGSGSNTQQQHDAIVNSYKELIKRQDTQIADLSQQLKKTQTELDQEKLNRNQIIQNGSYSHSSADSAAELESLRQQLQEKCTVIAEKERLLASARTDDTNNQTAESVSTPAIGECEKLRLQLEHLTVVCQQWQAEAARYQQFAQQWQQYQAQQSPEAQENQFVTTLEAQQRELESQLSYGWQLYEQQGVQMAELCKQNAELSDQLLQSNARLTEMETERNAERLRIQQNDTVIAAAQDQVATKTNELMSLRREQEDLLVLLADQDQKLRHYRRRLIDLEQIVSDVDDEEDDVEGHESQQQQTTTSVPHDLGIY